MLGTRLVHAWYTVGTCLVQAWYMLGTRLVHAWCKLGTCLVQITLTGLSAHVVSGQLTYSYVYVHTNLCGIYMHVVTTCFPYQDSR